MTEMEAYTCTLDYLSHHPITVQHNVNDLKNFTISTDNSHILAFLPFSVTRGVVGGGAVTETVTQQFCSSFDEIHIKERIQRKFKLITSLNVL